MHVLKRFYCWQFQKKFNNYPFGSVRHQDFLCKIICNQCKRLTEASWTTCVNKQWWKLENMQVDYLLGLAHKQFDKWQNVCELPSPIYSQTYSNIYIFTFKYKKWTSFVVTCMCNCTCCKILYKIKSETIFRAKNYYNKDQVAQWTCTVVQEQREMVKMNIRCDFISSRYINQITISWRNRWMLDCWNDVRIL
jgi:hypothetical protein